MSEVYRNAPWKRFANKGVRADIERWSQRKPGDVVRVFRDRTQTFAGRGGKTFTAYLVEAHGHVLYLFPAAGDRARWFWKGRPGRSCQSYFSRRMKFRVWDMSGKDITKPVAPAPAEVPPAAPAAEAASVPAEPAVPPPPAPVPAPAGDTPPRPDADSPHPGAAPAVEAEAENETGGGGDPPHQDLGPDGDDEVPPPTPGDKAEPDPGRPD